MKLAVKDWFHENKMNEKHKDVQSTNVFAILKESEKAYYVFVGDTRKSMAYWCPKSCTEEVPAIDDNGRNHSDALENLTYDEAYVAWKEEVAFYI